MIPKRLHCSGNWSFYIFWFTMSTSTARDCNVSRKMTVADNTAKDPAVDIIFSTALLYHPLT